MTVLTLKPGVEPRPKVRRLQPWVKARKTGPEPPPSPVPVEKPPASPVPEPKPTLAQAFHATFGDEPPPVLYTLVNGEPRLRFLPLALDTREKLPERLRKDPDRSDEQVEEAMRLVNRLVRHRRYLDAVAKDGSMRHNLDAEPVEPVSEEHRTWSREKLGRKPT